MNKLYNINNYTNSIFLNNIIEDNDPDKIYILNNNSHLNIHDYVYKDDYLEKEYISISGNVSKINNKYIEITNDYKENTRVRKYRKNISNKEDLLNILSKYRLTNILDILSNIDNISNIVISSIDEEVYDKKEFLLLYNYYDIVLDTIELLREILGINKITLTIKNIDSRSIKNVLSIIGTYPNIKLKLVPDLYLISRKEYLCKYLNYNIDKTIILKCSHIYDIYNILHTIDLSKKIITISGNAIDKSIVCNAKYGTSIKYLINKYVNIIDKDIIIYINGYLMGNEYTNNKEILYVNKDIDSIIINKNNHIKEDTCIKCGACNKVCPKNINVYKCFISNTKSNKCINCGLCNHICPSKIDLKSKVCYNK